MGISIQNNFNSIPIIYEFNQQVKGVNIQGENVSFDRGILSMTSQKKPSFVGKVWTREELQNSWKSEVENNQGKKKSLYEMMMASCQEGAGAKFKFAGEDKIYNFYEYISEIGRSTISNNDSGNISTREISIPPSHVIHGDNDKYGKEDYSMMIEQFADRIREKIKNGDTEVTYQIGGQSFTEKEWNKLVEKMDKEIDAIKSEQEERKNNQQAEKTSVDAKDTVLSGTKTAFDSDTYSYFRTDGMTVSTKDGTPLAEKALTDQRYTDKKTGISWYVGEDGKPYMVGDDVDKFDEICRENGEFPLKKFAEMTGMIQQLDDNTTAFVGDNGIAVKGKDGSEYLLDIAGMSYDNIMNMLSQATGGGDYYSDKYWNNIKNHL